MSTEKIKTSRASQTREKTVWTPPSSLDAPPAPAGFHHRWIRAETMGFDDTKNMAGRLRSGYEILQVQGVHLKMMVESKQLFEQFLLGSGSHGKFSFLWSYAYASFVNCFCFAYSSSGTPNFLAIAT